MRNEFFNKLFEIYEENESINLLTGDLGFKLFDRFAEVKPKRFYDMGVAEANMIGVAAGMSLSGKKVYCYSIMPFLIMRAYEQIRMDIAYHNLNVTLVGVGGGFTYGLEGYSHFGLEDFALMSSLPNMKVVAPADAWEATALAEQSVECEGPLFIRLGRTGDPNIHKSKPDFQIGKSIILREGKEIAICAVGNMVNTALDVALKLEKDGISVTVVNMHTLKPFDSKTLSEVSSVCSSIFTIEEHLLHGGLGSIVGAELAESSYNGLFRRFGIKDHTREHIGSAEYLREKYGLTADNIYSSIKKELNDANV